MSSSPIAVRYAARAIIIQDNRILCLKKVGDIGTFFVLPGGGQNPSELLSATVKRECQEELGAAIEVGRLCYVQEYVGDNHDFRKQHKGRHFVNHYFECKLLEPIETHPITPDDGQLGLEWLDVSRLTALPFFPRALAAKLVVGDAGGGEREGFYLGDSV